jgi:hypothetical protein
MKTINSLKIILLCGLTFSSLIAMSNNTLPTNTVNPRNAERTIKNYFKFPQVLLPHLNDAKTENKVEVVFTTNQRGLVNFVIAKTQNQILKEEIEKQFLKLTLPDLKKDVAHSVLLKFETL